MRQDAIARIKQERIMEMVRQSVAKHKSDSEVDSETEKSE